MELPLQSDKPSKLSSFLDEFSFDLPKLDAMRQGIELYGATKFSPFTIFSPDENTLSRVIAELFDPRGSHGQGLLFLNALMASIGFARLGPRDTVRVRREAMTRRRRRIDIVIETRDYVIGIENKPWAGQQTNQLSDYLDELSADLKNRTPILIFLSDQQARTARESVIRIPYFAEHDKISLHGLLGSVVGNIKAAPPRTFVEDFLLYIKITFGGEDMDDEADKPYLEAVGAEFDGLGKRKAIAAVLLAQYPLHIRILNDVGDYLFKEMNEKTGLSWEKRDHGGLGESLGVQYEPWGFRRKSWPANCHVAIEAHGQWYDKLLVGVRAPDAASIGKNEQQYASPARPILQNMTANIPGGRKSHWWPWYQWLPEGSWGVEFAARLIIDSPTGTVDSNPHMQELARQFVELGLAVERHLTGQSED